MPILNEKNSGFTPILEGSRLLSGDEWRKISPPSVRCFSSAEHSLIEATDSCRQSFTLIELLVVISIIGLLASIVLISLNQTRMKTRDAKRLANMHQIITALSLYHDDNGSYPPANRNWDSGSYIVYYSDSLSQGDNWITGLNAYMPQIPKDPLNTSPDSMPETWDGPYFSPPGEWVLMYVVSEDYQHYELLAPLESENSTHRCDRRCYQSTVFYPNRSWCGGIDDSCPNARFSSADTRGQHIFVINN